MAPMRVSTTDLRHRRDCYHCGEMTSSDSNRAIVLVSDKLMITKIITGIGLALLLILGASLGGHQEASPSTPLMASMALSPPSSNTAAFSDGGESVAVDGAIREGVIDSVMLGVAGCLLGFVCCLVVLIVARSLSTRVTLRPLGRLPRSLFSAGATGRPFGTTLSLTQLSISRT